MVFLFHFFIGNGWRKLLLVRIVLVSLPWCQLSEGFPSKRLGGHLATYCDRLQISHNGDKSRRHLGKEEIMAIHCIQQ